MSIAERIRDKLGRALDPVRLVIVDQSHLHAGHAATHRDGETHFRVEIVAAAFAGQSRVSRHRMVFDLLADELAERVHALSLDARTPEEVSRSSATSN